MNLYGYAFNDPVNFIDPQGRSAGSILGIGAVIGAGVFLGNLVSDWLNPPPKTFHELMDELNQPDIDSPNQCFPPSSTPKTAPPSNLTPSHSKPGLPPPGAYSNRSGRT